MNNTHDAAYAVGCVSSGCGGSTIAHTFDIQGLDAIISTTTNYPNNYVESADNAEEFTYSESTNYPMIDESADDQSCLAMFVPPQATDIIEESNWGNDALMNYFMSESKSKDTGLMNLVSNATNENSVTQSDMDYHLMVTSMSKVLPQKKNEADGQIFN